MAIDNTPPRLRLIGTIAIIVVITLVSLDFVFKSYYAYMTDEAQREKLAPRKDLIEQVAAEQVAFTGAKMPVDQAMKQVAASTRPELITPKQSDDLAPMTGWSKLPKSAPQAPGAEPHGALPAAGHADGGAALAADGGAAAALSTAGDAGAAPRTADGGTAPRTADGGAAPRTAPAPTAPVTPPAAKDAGAHAPQH